MPLKSSLERQTHNNFYFLKEGLGELYQQAMLAEQYYYTDPQSSLAKMRLFVELACHELGKHFALRPPVHGDLANKIKRLQASQSVDDWVIDAMHALRLAGNRSVHLTEVNGAYVAQLTMARGRIKQHMMDLYEIAQYVGYTILGYEASHSDSWQEPSSCELAIWIAEALKGNREASFFLAEKVFNELCEMSALEGEARWWHKEHFSDKQADLSYWLDKAHRQGHPQSWLLLAKCYARKWRLSTRHRDAKSCFKQALKSDPDGEAALEFARYLMQRDEHKLGEQYLHQAAKLGHHQALSEVLSCAYRSEKDLDDWLELAIEHQLPEAYTVQMLRLLQSYEREPSDVTLKALRSGLVVGRARQAPGRSFFKAYVDLTVHQNVDRGSALIVMKKDYATLPSYLPVELRLFRLIADDLEHYELMIQLYHQAVKQSVCPREVANIKFNVAHQALTLMQAKHPMRKRVKTPKPIPLLFKEAADQGDPQARTFVNSAEGRAALNKLGVVYQSRRTKNSAEKQKQKRRRKLAQKVNRK